jgi:hypothetical protein
MDPLNERSAASKKEIAETIVFMSADNIQDMLRLPWERFMGKSTISRATGQGQLEQDPHNNGHDWVGCRQGKNRDMGTLRYAALDPIFFMHHGNLDRIWSWYKQPQPDPDGPWGQQRYQFVDVDGSTVSVSVRDVVKYMTNVVYQEPKAAAPLLTAVAKQAATPQATKEKSAVIVQEGGELTSKPLTLKAAPQPANAPLLAGARNAAKPPLSLLEIETGPIAYTEKFTVSVYLDLPGANGAGGVKEANYIGRIHALDSDGRRSQAGQDITNTFSIMIGSRSPFYKLVPAGKPFSIILVPIGPAARDPNFHIAVKSVKLITFE